MEVRELFEDLYARDRTRRTNGEDTVTAADIRSHRKGDTYNRDLPAMCAAWHWFQLGRQTLVAVLPDPRCHSTDRADEYREQIIDEISESLFGQGINNVRSN